MAGRRLQREPGLSPPTPARNPDPVGAAGPAADGARVPIRPETTARPAPARWQSPAPGAHHRRPRSTAEVLALQRTAGNAAVVRLLGDTAPDPDHQGPDPRDLLRLPGRPLAESTLADMQARFGADFSDVRLHTGPAARRSADALGARAYTSGSHVVLGDGGEDKATLAHELAHVLQQRGGPVAGTDTGGGWRVSDPADEFERAATRTAALVLGRQPAQAPGGERPVHPRGEAHAAAGSAPAPDRAAATLQRVLVTQVDSTDGQTITGLTVAGRPESPYKGTMGDHSTAFAVQVDAVRRRVVGRSPDQAAEKLAHLYEKTMDLPGVGLFREVPLRDSPNHHRFNAACRAFETRHAAFAGQPESHKILELQLLVDDFLSARELVPLTTINVKSHYPALAGKGHGESARHETLFSHVVGKKQASSEELREAVWKLLDSQGVVLVATEVEAYKLAEMAPGLNENLSCAERVAILVSQHLGSIELAYPGIVAAAWDDVDDAAGALTANLQAPLEERRDKNRTDYLEKIHKCRERLIKIVTDRFQRRPGSVDHKNLGAALDKEDTLWESLAKVLIANGGKPPEKPSLTTPPRLGRRERRKPSRLVEQPEEASPSTRKRKRTDDEPAGATGALGTQQIETRKAAASAKGKERMKQGKDEEEEEEETVDAAVGRTDVDQAGPSGVGGEALDESAAQAEADEEEEQTERKQSLATQIILDRAGRITELRPAGRSKSPHSGTMGAHTTAWVVYVDVIRRRIEGRTVREAAGVIEMLAEEARHMSENLKRSGYAGGDEQELWLAESMENLAAHVRQLHKAPPLSAAQFLLVQRCVNDLLTMVNFIPGVSLEAADTGGKGEGTIRRRLLSYESGENPYDDEDPKRPLMKDLLGMLDIRAESGGTKRKALIKNHLRLITRAYPKATKDSGLTLMKSAELLDEWRTMKSFKRGAKRHRTIV